MAWTLWERRGRVGRNTRTKVLVLDFEKKKLYYKNKPNNNQKKKKKQTYETFILTFNKEQGEKI